MFLKGETAPESARIAAHPARAGRARTRDLTETAWIVTMNAAVVDAHAMLYAFSLVTPVSAITHRPSAAPGVGRASLHPFLSRRRNLAADLPACDLQECAQRPVHGSRIGERRCNVWLEQHDVGSCGIAIRILPPHATTDQLRVVLRQELIAFSTILSGR